jgi:16S rRNA (uracil1498-N3)-methyltransferase
MPRFYCDQPLEAGQLLRLPDHIARHVQVLRLKVGDVVTLFNGSGGEYAATVTGVDKKQVEVAVKTFSAREAEPAHAITLAQGLPEGTKMDWIVEKAVERMISRNRLGRVQMTNLRVYAGAAHPHEAQQPEVIDIKAMNPKNTRSA